MYSLPRSESAYVLQGPGADSGYSELLSDGSIAVSGQPFVPYDKLKGSGFYSVLGSDGNSHLVQNADYDFPLNDGGYAFLPQAGYAERSHYDLGDDSAYGPSKTGVQTRGRPYRKGAYDMAEDHYGMNASNKPQYDLPPHYSADYAQVNPNAAVGVHYDFADTDVESQTP